MRSPKCHRPRHRPRFWNAALLRRVGCPTPPPDFGPAPAEPEDCFFYSAAWQHFFVATHAGAGGQPAFVGYPNIASIFGDEATKSGFVGLKPDQLGVALRDVQRPNDLLTHQSQIVSIAEGVRQAGGLFGLVIDGVGNPVFYSIHVNQRFEDFLKGKGLALKDPKALKDAIEKDPNLEFDPGVVEFKAAWVLTPAGAPDDPNYIVAHADIPNLMQDGRGVLRLGTGNRSATLKLIVLHVAFTIKDHPEFIWVTFDHVTPGGPTDVAPSAETNDAMSGVLADPKIAYTLFAAGASRSSANSPCPGVGAAPSACDPTKAYPVFNALTQSFAGANGVQQTSVFREYFSSKSDRWASEDQSVIDLNLSLRALLAPAGGPRDKRANYRLVGATWLEHPRTGDGRPGDFVLNQAFANPEGQDTEDRSRVVAGEDMLSSMAMESFTQRDSPSCFSCHDTKAVRSDETGSPLILKPTALNVSHVLSRYLSQPK
ncbi:hypothetical protein E0H64_13955 [Rhizobium leguminosarum bv. viciae]|uniref:hypothetical protein n=1 Tax=Rhizobium leguminosarum TaxID=384 RepID=UPI00103F6761|nr:hypothetical protein [Rhizobium leguminosarum]MBY2967491.1 hypothetical protein [Rhizobium leguminosarum]TBZ68436.1 hypothetical protein E0H64_13955 [Rhizobium leguminosarum bv. viciae]